MYYDLTLQITPELRRDANGNDRFSLIGHLGTHFDIMNKAFPLNYLRLPAVFFDVAGIRDREINTSDIDLSIIKPGMFVGFCTGCMREYGYGAKEYFQNPVPLSEELIEQLISKKICIIGIDSPGIRKGKEHTPMDQHCADHGVFVVENMTGLEGLLGSSSYRCCHVNTYPVHYSDMTGLPCRVVAEVSSMSKEGEKAMNIKRIWAVYFSPTGGTKKAVLAVAHGMGEELGLEVQELNITSPESRTKKYAYTPEDLVIIGTPVYASRVPNKLLPAMESCFEGNGAKVIPVSVYGNRSFGDALMELKLVMEANGFLTAAAAAIVSRHTFSQTLAAGRPDEKDLEEIRAFCRKAAAAWKAGGELPVTEVPGNNPVGPYYTPLQEDGTPAKFLKAKPVTDPAACVQCGLCAKACPMGSIDAADCAQVPGICIKCQACIRTCPKHAKQFTDPQFLSHKRMLEQNFTRRADNYFSL